MAENDGMSSADLFQSAVAPEPAPAPPEATPPAPEPTPPAPEPPAPPAPESEATVPSWRLREESEARRAFEEENRSLKQRLEQVAAHLQQSQKKPDFFERPEETTNDLITRALKPYVEENRKVMMQLTKEVATQRHGEDKVDSAEKAFLKAMNEQALDPMEYEQVVQAPNRYDAVVKWHTRQNVLSSVGNDPAAWFAKQLEERMSDPKFQADLLSKIQAKATAKPGVVELPPSLSKAAGTGGNGREPAGDMSDSSLFQHAMYSGRQ